MSLEIGRSLGVSGINSNIYIDRNRYNNSFGNNLSTDSFETQSLTKYSNPTVLNKLISNNPKIKSITKDFNPNLNLNIKELNDLFQGHANDTKNIANGIADNLPFSLKSTVDYKAVSDAAYLHDLGKVLIPTEILNKPARLDEKETKIMQTHSELSYEILKNTNIDKRTLMLIRNHHQNAKKTGYPWVNKDFNADINLQILSAADKFSALTEKRTYKEPLSNKQALTIIYQDVKEGKLHPFVFKALVNYANSNHYVKVS